MRMPMNLPRHHPHWPRRLPRAITVPDTSLWHNLEVNAERYADKAALHFLGRAYSYAQLRDAALALAGHLHARGVRQGDRVLVAMQNCPQLVIAHFAVMRANAVVVPVNPMYRADELRHYIQDAQAKVAIASADVAPALASASEALAPDDRLAELIVTQYVDGLPADLGAEFSPPAAWRDWLLLTAPLPKLDAARVTPWKELMDAAGTAPAAPALTVCGRDLALLPYTSGTTGQPKGCRHRHSSLMHNAIATQLWTASSSETIMLAAVPMFHITGIVSLLHTTIVSGGALVIMPRWDRDLAGRLISHYGVTNWTNIPTMVIDLLASPHFESFDLTSLHYIGGGGAAMPKAVAQRLLDAYGLVYVEGYGLTETAAPSHLNPFERPKQQCLGIPFMSTDACVIDPATLVELPVGEAGEIVVRGPGVFDGYWGQPEATRRAFIDLPQGSYFRTGDIGMVDSEGYFFLVDRLKRMINASGFKVWPAELELQLYQHPAVQEACIVGTQDAYRGESVKALIVLRAGHEDVDVPAIIGWCREHMAAYKVPHDVEFVLTLPKSATGKILWRELQEQERRRGSAATPG